MTPGPLDGRAEGLEDGPDLSPAVTARLVAVAEVARRRRSPMALESLVRLLPGEAPPSAGEVARWLAARPHLGRLEGDEVIPPDTGYPADLAGRRVRSDELSAEAREAMRGPLRVALQFVRMLGVSGSVAYGLAGPEDDLDFVVVTRRGATWLFLLAAFLARRRARRGARGRTPTNWCFNYVVEEGVALAEFARPQGFLVAREALMVRVLEGDPYYRELLRASSWMEAELPTLYRQTVSSPGPAPRSFAPAWPLRWLNACLYPPMAAYLRAVELVGNRRLRRTAPEKRFRTEVSPRRLALRTVQFEELARVCAAASVLPAPSAGRTAAP